MGLDRVDRERQPLGDLGVGGRGGERGAVLERPAELDQDPPLARGDPRRRQRVRGDLGRVRASSPGARQRITVLPDADHVAVAQAPAPADPLAVHERAVLGEPVVDEGRVLADELDLGMERRDLAVALEPQVRRRAAADPELVRARLDADDALLVGLRRGRRGTAARRARRRSGPSAPARSARAVRGSRSSLPLHHPRDPRSQPSGGRPRRSLYPPPRFAGRCAERISRGGAPGGARPRRRHEPRRARARGRGGARRGRRGRPPRRLLRGGRRHPQRGRGLGRGRRRQGRPPESGRDRRARRRPGPDRVLEPAHRRRLEQGARRRGRDQLRDGGGAPDHARPVDGRPLLAGQRRGLRGHPPRRPRVRPVLPDDDHGRRHGLAREGAGSGRRRRRAAGDRDRQAPRRDRHRLRHPPRRLGADRLARRPPARARLHPRRRGRGRLRAPAHRRGEREGPRGARRERREAERDHHHRPDPGPQGADPDHRAGDREHGAGLGDHRPRRRDAAATASAPRPARPSTSTG